MSGRKWIHGIARVRSPPHSWPRWLRVSANLTEHKTRECSDLKKLASWCHCRTAAKRRDPAIHDESQHDKQYCLIMWHRIVDARVKPGHDAECMALHRIRDTGYVLPLEQAHDVRFRQRVEMQIEADDGG